MKVLVIGATGRVGSLLVKKLSEKGHTVLAGSREDKTDKSLSNVEYVRIDLTSDSDTLARAMQNGVEAVYFTSGSRGKNLLQIDLHGAIKTMQAAEKAGVKRYIMLSSIFALQPERWEEDFLKDIPDYNIAKHYADHYLIHNTDLDYTILQPGGLEETPPTGKIQVNVQETGKNSISDVVETLACILGTPATVKKVIIMHKGDTPIKEALEQVV